MDEVKKTLTENGFQIADIKQDANGNTKKFSCNIKKSFMIPNMIQEEEEIRKQIKDEMLKIEALLPNCKITWSKMSIEKSEPIPVNSLIPRQLNPELITFKYVL